MNFYYAQPSIFLLYLAVGAGSAGCVLANRLSEDNHVTVLLLEAGPDDRKHPKTSVPGHVLLLYHSELDWDYYTEPQQFALQGFENNVSFLFVSLQTRYKHEPTTSIR